MWTYLNVAGAGHLEEQVERFAAQRLIGVLEAVDHRHLPSMRNNVSHLAVYAYKTPPPYLVTPVSSPRDALTHPNALLSTYMTADDTHSTPVTR